MDKEPIFHRHEAAARLASMLLGNDPLSNAGRSGLFLSAPRRTGKSTFLKNDLVPTLQAAGAIAVYVDLWTDRTRDPADLIADAVRDTLAEQIGRLKKATGVISRLRKLSAKGKFAAFEAELGFEIESVGHPGGATLAKAFEGLHRAAGKPIVFIIDEAQHALSTERGGDTLFALKAARDALNLTADKPQLAILATGSLRGKISNLVMRKNQAFYGADIASFPPLGAEFVAHMARHMLSHRLSAQQMPATDKLLAAFNALGKRPEELARAIKDAVIRAEPDLGDAIVAAATLRRGEIVGALRRQVESLPPLQHAVLRRMADDEDNFVPFSKESLAWYQQHSGNPKVAASAVQKALDALVATGFVWRSAYGTYALDDEMMADYFLDEAAKSMFAILDSGGVPAPPRKTVRAAPARPQRAR
jgi:hypothetical protein